MTEHDESQAISRLLKVLDISRAMVAASDLDQLLSLVVDRSMELLDSERASVFLYDTEHNELVTRVAAGVDELRIPADTGISGATIATGQTINVPDAYADDRFNPDTDRKTGFRTRNLLSIPLRGFEGGLVGILQVLNKRNGTFDATDIMLGETLAAQAGVAIQRATLIEHYLHKLEMERAMRIARDIQRGLLPEADLDIPGFDIAGFSRPADETGGDIYDFMPLGDGRWMFVVADATGHGIGPALVIAETRAMLRAMCLQGNDVSSVLTTVNNLLIQDLDNSRFVTCFVGILDPDASTLRYASAGHGPLLFYNRRKDAFRAVSATGLPLGVMDDFEYDQVDTLQLEPGDLAVITTDGFFEAAGADDEMFGIGRMTDLLRRDREQTARAIIENLDQAVTAFVDGRPQADDLTALIIARR